MAIKTKLAGNAAFRSRVRKVNNVTRLILFRTRESAKLTMRSLADKVGVPHSLIGKIEVGISTAVKSLDENDRHNFQKRLEGIALLGDGRKMSVGEFISFCEAMEVDPVRLFAEIVSQSSK
jgi:hypothetical protein